jgi:nucleotide-binding universal stress UspA family protein
MKILIGIDDSKFSRDLLRAIVTQFRTEHTEVRVLHVLEPVAPAPPEMAAGYAPELEDQKKPARELVERIAKELRSCPCVNRLAL